MFTRLKNRFVLVLVAFTVFAFSLATAPAVSKNWTVASSVKKSASLSRVMVWVSFCVPAVKGPPVNRM